MSKKYILSLDQSTQGTKALLFDDSGRLLMRRDKTHRQIISQEGWISHDPEEIYKNTVEVLQHVILDSGIDRDAVVALGISNQRETSVAWERDGGRSIGNAVVWQCNRGLGICEELNSEAKKVKLFTSIDLSPYFPASKFAWMIRNREDVRKKWRKGNCVLEQWMLFWCTA